MPTDEIWTQTAHLLKNIPQDQLNYIPMMYGMVRKEAYEIVMELFPRAEKKSLTPEEQAIYAKTREAREAEWRKAYPDEPPLTER